MKFNFDQIIDRRGSDSYKWNLPQESDIIPMWVADMDFHVAPAIVNALEKRVQHGIFGYVAVPNKFYEATINWFQRRHDWSINRDWFLYTSGVVPAVSAIVKAFTKPGDKVLLQTPAYNCFFSSIKNNGCEIVENALQRHGNTYRMDLEDLAQKLKDEKVKIMLLCNPHNPVGRVWTREELQQVDQLCRENGVIVVSDEIHCELTMPGYQYVPFASLSAQAQANCITSISPSKSFNIAGLQIASIITNQTEWREKIDRALNINEVCDVNPFGVEAVVAAYNESEDWIDELQEYLWSNYQALCQFIANEMPQLKVTKLEGTYLVWVDITATGMNSDTLTQKLLDEGKVWVNSGTMYGAEQGEGFIRINIACPQGLMLEGLKRMKGVLNNS